MIYPLGGLRFRKAALLAGLAMTWVGAVVPASAQDNMMEARLRRMEAEIRSLQGNRTGADGKVFTPEVSASPVPGAEPVQPATTPVTDLLARMEALEAQIKQLTAQSEINSNRLAKLEAAASATAPATAGAAAAPAATPTAAPAGPSVTLPAPVPATAAAPAPTPSPAATQAPAASVSNMSAMTSGASSPRPAASPAPSGRAAAPARPSPQRLAAVSAIAKPQTSDPGDDEYSYGFRLWEAKFYPEAQQQLKLMIDKYPRHPKISFAKNLLGRAYLDDGKPREAASWFLQNYQANKGGERAPDSLLYLAESMRQLRDTSRGCIALSEFAETYPREAATRLKGQYDATRGGLKCN